MSLFESLEEQPGDPIFSLMQEFRDDPSLQKINLGIGSYNDENGVPVLFNSVKQAEKELLDIEKEKEYLPIDGLQSFRQSLTALILGETQEGRENQLYSAQTVGGSGALCIAANLIKTHLTDTIYISKPTWANHPPLFIRAGLTVKEYPYFDHATQSFSAKQFVKWLSALPPKSALLLHGSCHNPTGCDPSDEEWTEILSLLKERQLFPLIDLAYQGLGAGLEEDAALVRRVVESEIECMIAASCSKNFGLYAERVGLLLYATTSCRTKKIVASHLKPIIRQTWSNPPKHGALVVSNILNCPRLKASWSAELDAIRHRVVEIRQELSKKLGKEAEFIARQKGFFSLLGLTPEEVSRLKKQSHIYLPKSGRINLAGINSQNIEVITSALQPLLVERS